MSITTNDLKMNQPVKIDLLIRHVTTDGVILPATCFRCFYVPTGKIGAGGMKQSGCPCASVVHLFSLILYLLNEWRYLMKLITINHQQVYVTVMT